MIYNLLKEKQIYMFVCYNIIINNIKIIQIE